MERTAPSISQWIINVAKECGYDFNANKMDGAEVLNCQFPMDGGFQQANLEIVVRDEIRVTLTPAVEISQEALPRVNELFKYLNLNEVGELVLDCDRRTIRYSLEARFEDITSDLDITFLWLTPLTRLTALQNDILDAQESAKEA